MWLVWNIVALHVIIGIDYSSGRKSHHWCVIMGVLQIGEGRQLSLRREQGSSVVFISFRTLVPTHGGKRMSWIPPPAAQRLLCVQTQWVLPPPHPGAWNTSHPVEVSPFQGQSESMCMLQLWVAMKEVDSKLRAGNRFIHMHTHGYRNQKSDK